MNRKNILFISYDGMTDPLGQSQVIPYLQGLSRHYDIILLSCEKKPVFTQNRKLVEDLLIGFNIQWIPLAYTRNPPVISTWWDITRMKAIAKKIFLKYGIDMVHTRPGIPSLIGLWLKKKYGVKYLNDIREFYADSRVDCGMWNKKNILYNFIYRYFKKRESESISRSDGIVCLTVAARNIIYKLPEYNKRIPLMVIPCSVDLELFDPSAIIPEEKDKFRIKLDIKDDDIIVSYLGSIGGWYLTDEMMECCGVILNKIPAVKFLFISPHRHKMIVKAAIKFGIPEEKIVVYHASRSEVPVLLSFSRYSLFFIKPCFSKLSSSPTKHGEIMAMGVPVITNSGVGDLEEIVKKYNSGFVLTNFGRESFNRLAEELSLGGLYNKDSIRNGAKEYYSLSNAIKNYEELYAKILS